tara:strand:- start:122 stop:727 length:606 start_codon:yes stop_codon:yes gene_type:complete
MKYKLYSHRFAQNIVNDDKDFISDYKEVISVIENISDSNLKERFIEEQQKRPNTKSLSTSINGLIKDGLEEKEGWNPESAIFKEEEYEKSKSYWRLDFAKASIAIEVAFNHQEATAHNIMKPVLAGELNHVEKAIQSRLGIIICATDNLKKQGGFDGTVGTYEKFISFMRPYNSFVTIPLLIIGLESPDTFLIMDKKIINL